MTGRRSQEEQTYLALSTSAPRIHDNRVSDLQWTVRRNFFSDDVNDAADFVTQDGAFE